MTDQTNNIPDLSKRMHQLKMMNKETNYQNLKIDSKQLYSKIALKITFAND